MNFEALQAPTETWLCQGKNRGIAHPPSRLGSLECR